MSRPDSTSAIFYAFAANLGIALAKTVAALWTGSGSMLAEAIHSYADCGNQALLFIGLKRSEKTATPKHPMGFGRESYIWSMMVTLILFSVGGVFSVYEGWLRFINPHEVENGMAALLVLIAAVAMETFSLKGALAAMEAEKGDRSLWQWFKETHSSELMVVTGEDLAALLGLIIALIMLSLTLITGNSAFDALGSLLIGVLLIAVASIVGYEIHSLLLGEADQTLQTAITGELEAHPHIIKVFNVWAINHGKNIVLSIKAQLQGTIPVTQAVDIINTLEREIKEKHPRVRWVFFELDNTD
ncbi:MAG: cation efflux family transporter [Gammaproteobacteria bacterium HGW-Gammaproteobacteria-3]|nr:MAG: cation efflux family transporter [Gammaproteobacteria bacterium HGW-Gammaproteobacteria-3]